MKIIVIVGLPGAGKDTAAGFLREKGIPFLTFSSVIKDEIKQRGIMDSLENEEVVAKDLRKKFGRDIVAKRIAEKISNLKKDYVCLVGPRNIEELEYLKDFGEIILLVIEADKKIRFERMKRRGDSRDPKTFEEFEWRENKNLELGIDKVLKTKKYPKYVIQNNGTPEELKKHVEKIIRMILKPR